MLEWAFLFIIGLVWVTAASIQDLKSREVANWLNFSLIIFALGFRFFFSLFAGGGSGFGFFYQGLIGLGVFWGLGNLLYYGRMFAGGDAKLMIALGAILPLSTELSINIMAFTWFFLLFLVIGGFYGVAWSLVLCFRNLNAFKREFKRQGVKYRKISLVVMALGLLVMIFALFSGVIFWLGVLIFILPYFYLYAKAVDEACMVKKLPVNKLTEGDWLYKDVKVGRRLIKPIWAGLSKKDIKDIKKKYKVVEIRQGIPFVPVFLIAFIALGVLYYFNYTNILELFLWNSFW